MKKAFLLLCMALFVSCSSDDDQPEDPVLEGEWYLVDIYCYCGFEEDIDLNAFRLHFNETEKTVQLENPTEDYFYLAESGIYEYRLQEDRLLLAGAPPFKYTLKGNELTLTLVDDPGIADDELVLGYRRG